MSDHARTVFAAGCLPILLETAQRENELRRVRRALGIEPGGSRPRTRRNDPNQDHRAGRAQVPHTEAAMSLASVIFLLVAAFCLGILAGRAQVAHLVDYWRDSAVMWEKVANRWKERVLHEHDN